MVSYSYIKSTNCHSWPHDYSLNQSIFFPFLSQVLFEYVNENFLIVYLVQVESGCHSSVDVI